MAHTEAQVAERMAIAERELQAFEDADAAASQAHPAALPAAEKPVEPEVVRSSVMIDVSPQAPSPPQLATGKFGSSSRHV